MAKRLTMAEIDTILTLHRGGESNRAIAALLGVDRGTVGRVLGRGEAGNQPNAPTGNKRDDPSGGQAEGDADAGCAGAGVSQPSAPAGSAAALRSGPQSGCEPFREQILAKIELDLDAVRIHQDLVQEHRQNAPSYYSVRRFVARLTPFRLPGAISDRQLGQEGVCPPVVLTFPNRSSIRMVASLG